MVDKFSLKWNNFHSNISKSFEILRNDEYLHDVTLVGDDFQPVLAHKLVLSACSEYFQNIFKMNHNNHYKHPLICLNGITSEVISNVLDYMYYGEVQVYQEDIDSFLEIAQRLKLTGIKSTAAAINQFNPVNEATTDTCEKIVETPKLEPDEISEEHELVVEPPPKLEPDEITEEPQLVNLENSDSNISLNQKIEKYIENGHDGNYKCNQCGKLCKRKSTLRYHIEIHIPGLEFSCNVCGKVYKSRNTLSMHKSTKHKTLQHNTEKETKDHSWIL